MAEETDKMGAAIAEIRAELAQGAVTRSIFAQITESPCNLHQATVHFAAMDDKASPLSKGCLLLSSVLMVLGQCAVATAVFVGVNTPSCISSDQCHQLGTYCQCRNTVADRLICSERGMEAGRCKCKRHGVWLPVVSLLLATLEKLLLYRLRGRRPRAAAGRRRRLRSSRVGRV